MTIETRDVTVTKCPTDALDFLKPFAVADGRSESDASVARYAVVELVRRIREAVAQQSNDDKRPAGTSIEPPAAEPA